MMEFSNMSPVKRILLKKEIDSSKESSRFAASVGSQYPIFKIIYQIAKDYSDLPFVNKYYIELCPPDRAFVEIAVNILYHIKFFDEQDGLEEYEQKMRIIKIIEDSLDYSLKFLDQFQRLSKISALSHS